MRVTTSLCTALLAATVASPAAAYEVAPVSNGGSIEGKVTFTGSRAGAEKVIPTKDKEVCGGVARGAADRASRADKGVQDAVVYLKGVEKGKAWDKAGKTPVHRQPGVHLQARRPGDARRRRSRSSTPIPSCTTPTASTASGPRSTSRCRTRASGSRSCSRSPGWCASSATPTAGCSGWIYVADTRTTPSLARTAVHASPTCRPASTRWSSGTSTPGRPRRRSP